MTNGSQVGERLIHLIFLIKVAIRH
uniref:Uncharacterized protein n=1 Tax=Arundo donax TaxID=35708 RepID=A0A0A8Z7R0_ARUDO